MNSYSKLKKRLSINGIRRLARQQAAAFLRGQAATLPRVRLRPENLSKNGRLVLNRREFLECLPKGGIVAELGVDEGNFTREILELNTPKTLHLVDLWMSERYNDDKFQAVQDLFSDSIADGTISLHRKRSVPAAELFENNYFDWVYIDTDHSYATTLQELRAWAPKVKSDGFLCGHDYVMGNWDKHVKYGVIEAVHQFCVEDGWRIEFISADFVENNSFAIRRIDA